MAVVGKDERKFYTDDADLIFAALHEWDNVKERRHVEVFGGAGNGRVMSSSYPIRPAAGSTAALVLAPRHALNQAAYPRDRT